MTSTARVIEIVAYAQAELQRLADPLKAGPMAAYLKSDMPFYGVQTPARRPIAKELVRRFPPATNREYREQVLALWALPHREEKYLALAIAARHTRYVRSSNLDLYRRLIAEGAWWDLVDAVATAMVGVTLRNERAKVAPVLTKWIDHRDMWLRRTALIAQVGHKEHTDETMLFDFCLRRAAEEEFFIRKAIGWALREYSKTSPDAVKAFLAGHGNELSGLSRREAAKHL